MLDGVLQSFLQHAVETQGNFPGSAFGTFSKWTSIVTPCRLETSSQNPATAAPAPGGPAPGMKAMRQRLNIGRQIRNLPVDFRDLLLEIGC